MGDAPYRVPLPPRPDPHALAWARVRRARRVAAASLLGIVGCSALMGVAAELRATLVAVLLEVGVGVFIVLGLTNSPSSSRPPRD